MRNMVRQPAPAEKAPQRSAEPTLTAGATGHSFHMTENTRAARVAPLVCKRDCQLVLATFDTRARCLFLGLSFLGLNRLWTACKFVGRLVTRNDKWQALRSPKSVGPVSIGLPYLTTGFSTAGFRQR